MSLKASAISGAKWTAASATASTCIQIAQLTVLSRLLSPEDFGLMSMLMVVTGFAQLYCDVGISNAIICRQQISRNELSSLFWLNILAGGAIFLVLWVLAPGIAAFYEEPRLIAPMRLAAVALLIAPLGQQFQVLLQKELRFRGVALCEIFSRLAGFIVATVSAFLGGGVYALVWGTLATAIVLAIALACTGWPLHRPGLHFSFNDTRGFLGFGVYQMGERSINYLGSNIDKLLIGRMLGADALGFYTLAWNLVIQPVARINPVLTRIAFPVFARLQNERGALKRAYMKMLDLLSTTNFVVLLGICAVAPVLIPVVFGARWSPAIIVAQILAAVSLIRSVINPVGYLLLASGRADIGFKWNAALFFTQLLGVLAGARIGGLEGVSCALLVLHVSYFFLSFRFLISNLLEVSWKEYFVAMFPALWISLTMGLGIWMLGILLARSGVDQSLQLATVICAGVIYFCVVTLLVRRTEVEELLHYVRVPIKSA